MLDIARLEEHVADAVVAVIDRATVDRDRIGQVILHTGEPIEIVILEMLSAAPLAVSGNERRGALIRDRSDVRDRIQVVGPVDELSGEWRVRVESAVSRIRES